MNCNSLDQASFPSSGALSTSGSEPAFSFSQIMEGYDNEFVPHPESRYECPICLLVLREPRQTKCGHRFCRDCIIRSLRDSSNRCPVDNEPLKDNDIYPDNFAKREILNFNIKCPKNRDGCDKIFPLGKLQKHLEECPYALMPCPYKCGFIMQRMDVDNHLATSCENRIILCENCHCDIQAKLVQNHLSVCPEAVVACPHCKDGKTRKELNYHIQTECQLVEVNCPFHLIGCGFRKLRSCIDDHIMLEGPAHMKLLCYAVTHLTQKLGMTDLNSEASLQNVQKTLSNGLFPPMGAHSTSHSGNYGNTLTGFNSDRSYNDHEDFDREGLGYKREVKSNLINNGKILVSVGSFDDGQHQVTVAQYQSHDSPDRQPSSLSDLETEQNQRPPSSSQVPRAKLPVRRLNYQPIFSIPSVDMIRPQSTSPYNSLSDQTSEEGAHGNLNAVNMIQELKSQFEKKHSLQEQKFYDLCTKFAAVQQMNAELVEKVRNLEQLLAEKDVRCLNGEFYWSINQFRQYTRKLAAGENSVLHSPPFYSSPWGYKMCVRANVASSNMGSHLSLFVHFMQGSNDMFLTWPFSGKITICVMDQNPDCSRRVHMKETLKSNPNIAAFQRPIMQKNSKGFGYPEFLSIAAIENSTFLADDTLIIRVQVSDDSR